MAVAHAESEFEKFRLTQLNLFESDFDKALKKTISSKSDDKENTI
jgi:hypothetical protein